MIVLSTDQVVKLHQMLIAQTGGLDGIRDVNLLESALNAPFQSFNGFYIYPTIESMAARLAYGIVKNHAFADGNKRIGVLAMLTFLDANGVFLDCSDQEVIDIGLGLADGSIDYEALLQWILAHKSLLGNQSGE